MYLKIERRPKMDREWSTSIAESNNYDIEYLPNIFNGEIDNEKLI